MKKIVNGKKCSDAVSPVVGVMLMLVVTIIIAAVVSAFAGGLGSEQQKAPTASIDISIVNKGYSYFNGMYFKVNSVSEPISTKDVRIITSWKAQDGTTGGATIMPITNATTPNTHIINSGKNYYWHAPAGYGGKINFTISTIYLNPEQNWGNYTLTPGIASTSQPYYTGTAGYGGKGTDNTIHYYQYVDIAGVWDSTLETDATQAVLGKEWYHLRAGDVVNVKFIHIPSGQAIVDKEVVVTS